MNLRSLVESEYGKQTEEFAARVEFQALERGAASRADYDRFIEGVCRSHLKSPHILAFLFAVAPPGEARKLKENMLEELGLDANGAGVSHPSLLVELMKAAGFDEARCARLEREAEDELYRIIASPILYATLREFGLGVLLETVSFEWMLSRMSSRMASFLRDHRQLPARALEWFYHHAEVDARHAEEGLDAVAGYIAAYEFDPLEAQTILEITFRENVFVKRYFGHRSAGSETRSPARS